MRTLVHCWWNVKWLQKTVEKFDGSSKTLNHKTQQFHSQTYVKELKIGTHIVSCMPVFTVAFF